MTTILRSVESDLTTVRVDFNALATGSTGFGYFALDLGSVDPDVDWLSQKPYPGATKAISADPLVPGSVRFYAKHTTLNDLIALARTLDTELQRESIWEFRPDGASASAFLIIPTFSRPALFRGDNLVQVIRQFQDPEGLPVSFLRQPWVFKAPGELTSATVTNEVGSRHVSYTQTANLPSPVKIEASIADSSAETAAMRIFRKVFADEDDRDEFETHYSVLATDLSATYGANTATSGGAARVTFAAVGYFLPRVKWVITPTLKSALTGSYRVMAVVKASVDTKVSIKILHGNRDVDPLDNQQDPVSIDLTEDVGSSVYVEKELGTVSFDEDGEALVIEFHAQCDTTNGGTDTLDFLQFYLAPVGQSVMAHSPGLMNAGRVSDRWDGSELTTPSNPGSLTAGAVDEKTIVLNADNEAAGTKPNTGIALPVAWHLFELEATLYEPGSSGSTQHGEFRIRNITDSTTTATKALKTKGSREWTTVTKTIRFLSVTGKSYQPQVEFTDGSPTSGAKIVVKRLTHSVIPIVNNDAKFVLDGIENEAEIQTSTHVRTSELKLREGGYPVVPTGYVIDIFSFLDVAPLGYEDASDSPLQKVVETREAAVVHNVMERFSH